ncbi:adenylate/guanylate cyclase domain-containing protein [Parachitinimonas caeni]|uniref:Adenylate/guanylate cyclase domain-containing protein n=1 Tax=Parachitinimonas caeni TaxID=3031301 RepID=A0ABT7E1I7_9NEIS|nr:adenylate/guanylate cyclase domain-containing protein [Parachitinimonas caeni]MDK2125275.1 adenylate/guanylate cyclase domain-containing protein [Parachitinimonas caeni]
MPLLPFIGFRLRRRLALVATVLAALTAAEGLYRSNATERIEHFYSDLWHRLAGVRATPGHVVLVVIDDQSLAAYPDDPLVFWSPYVAQASQVLRQVGASAIGLDILYGISPERWLAKMDLPNTDIARRFDQNFRREVASGKVALAATTQPAIDAGYDQFRLPQPEVLLSAPDLVSTVGLADLPPDSDGLIRRMPFAPPINLRPELRQGSPRLSLPALLAVRAAGLKADAAGWNIGGRQYLPGDPPFPIAFYGPPNTVPRVSISRLLAPGALQDPQVLALRGKVVIIGADSTALFDWHQTPYAVGVIQHGSFMAGAEILANAVETLLSGRRYEAAPDHWRWAWLGSFLLVGTALFWRLRSTPALIAFAALSAVAASTAFQAFLADWMLPLASLQLGLAVALLLAFAARLSQEARDRALARQAWGRYVSPAVLEAVLESGRMPDLGGEAAEVTVLFADLRDFTTISEKLAPNEVVEMLNAYFERVCEPILKEGGSVDKFIGDAVMAEFGAPLPLPDHARRALRAALRMREIAIEFQQWMDERFPRHDLPLFRIGIGIHTGTAVLGNIGSTQKADYTAVGDTVNIASRLEGLTKVLGCTVAASAATVRAAGSGIVTGAQRSLQVKGREEAVEVFEVVGIREEAS